MKSVKQIIFLYKLVFRRWPYATIGILAMFLYGIFSVASLPIIQTLVDDIFKSKAHPPYEIESVALFLSHLSQTTRAVLDQHHFSLWQISSHNISLLYDSWRILFQKTNPYLLLQLIIFVFICITLLKNIFFYLNRIMFVNLEGKTAKDLRDMLFSKYLNLSFSFFETHKVGDAIVRIGSDVNLINQHLVSNTMKISRDLLQVILFISVAYAINTGLFLKILFIIPGILLAVSYLGNKIKKYTRRLQNQLALLFANVDESFRGMKIIKAFNRERYESHKYRSVTQKYFRIWRRRFVYEAFNTPLSETSGAITMAVVMWFGGKDVLDPAKTFTFGSFSAFLVAIGSIMHPLKTIIKSYTDIKKAMVSLHRVSEILEQPEKIITPDNPVRLESFKDKIQYRNVFFSYNNDPATPTLSNINLDIRKGQQVAFVGATGSGKTTLVNLLPRFYDVTQGQILIDGIDIRHLELKNLRSLFGYVTQEAFLFNATIAENVSYGLGHMDMEKVKEACEIAYAAEFIEKFPKGYDTMISDYGGNLSGGQKQRLSIARAIIHNPEILIFDEATSALDAESENKVQTAIDNVTQNRTLIVIAHRLATILKADNIVLLSDGKIKAIGTHQELLRSSEDYKRLYELQFETSSENKLDI